ncbi:morphogenesis protein Mor2 [Schizosaccharomyces cryophilus OY26]|uniref:Morphogenesis protein Mor2 n=1 Tax=Schizosaccharomyces cryophilus (strain OY26 / ATCC MYA-4695 / CBS 11777 / NBRC 106824 / NRRL Y48691) TaxID=653667 RepID=S9W1G8_SCHCR|nr:morphogenesis protein Mor2 [Schizosaccharomyces cryophilus OY26]EPY53823.1 morphogenesis protein Mor2 [Schizosaccharomyces cryophilus OY26]
MNSNETAQEEPFYGEETDTPSQEEQQHSAVDYALHILFTQFVRISEQKIFNLARHQINRHTQPYQVSFTVSEQDAIRLLRKGHDEEFDRCIQALIGLATKKPVAVIESLLYWRKVRVNVTNTKNIPHFVAERKNFISVYILCRSLSEITESLPNNTFEESTVSSLLECIFHQLLNPKNLPNCSSSLRLANWESFAYLLGSLSRFNFVMVSDRFIEEIEKLEKSNMDFKVREAYLIYILRAMRHLHIRLYPIAHLEECVAFLESLASFFIKSNQAVQIEHAFLFENLLSPLVIHATFEVNIPAWIRTVHSLYPVAFKSSTKSKFWHIWFPFLCSLLCLSPKEFFLENWLATLEASFVRIKDRRLRCTGLKSVAKVLWVCLNRLQENTDENLENISYILKPIFFQGKTFNVTPFATVDEVEGFSQLLRVLAPHYPDYVINEILEPLLMDAFNENMGCEKMMIAVRSSYYILQDIRLKNSSKELFNFIDFQFIDLWSDAMGSCWQTFIKNLSQRALFLILQLSNDTNRCYNSRNPAGYLGLYSNSLKIFPCLTAKIEPKIIDAYVKCLNCPNKVIHLSCHNALLYFASTLNLTKPVISCLSRKLVQGSEYLLRTYHEVIQIWIQQQEAVIEKRSSYLSSKSNLTSDNENASLGKQDYDETQSWMIIEEIQSLAVLHLSSPSVDIRQFAVALLNDVKKLNTEYLVLSSDNYTTGEVYSEPTIVDVLKDCDSSILSIESHLPTAAERSRLRKFINDGTKDMLLKLATSNSGVDISIWYNVFPKFIKVCFERFPTTMALLRNTVCAKLPSITSKLLSKIDISDVNFNLKSAVNNNEFPEYLLVQWKLYLIVACCTITYTSNLDLSQTNLRRALTAVQSGTHLRSLQETTKITSAESLFSMILPLIFVDFSPIREAVVFATGCINVNAFPQLVRSLKPYISFLKEEKPEFLLRNLNFNFGRRNKSDNLLRSEIAHIFALTSHLLIHDSMKDETDTLLIISEFLKDLKIYLTSHTQGDVSSLKTKCYFAQLLEKITLYQNMNDSFEILPLSGRVSCWKLLDEWTGFGPAKQIMKNNQDEIRRNIMESQKDMRERDRLLASFEVAKQNLEYLAIKAMITLSTSRLHQELGEAIFSFDVEVLLNWYTAVFNSLSKVIINLARKGLCTLLIKNWDNELLLQKVIEKCFLQGIPQQTCDYFFLALSEMLVHTEVGHLSIPKLLPLCLVKLSANNISVRLKAFELLGKFRLNSFTLTTMMEMKSFLESSNPALYLKPQYLFSVQLANDFSEASFALTSECLRYFNYGDFHRRGLVTVLLPWLQNLELKMDVGNKTFEFYTVAMLMGLIEVTTRYTKDLPNEIEALWTSLALSGHKKNWTVILFFLMQQCFNRKTFAFVECTRQITIYLAKTEILPGLYATLLSFISSTNASNENQEVFSYDVENSNHMYIADLDSLFPPEKDSIFYSPCQLSLLLLMDIVPNPSIRIGANEIATILQAAFIQLDHYSKIVRKQCRQIIHYIVEKVQAMEGRLYSDDNYFSLLDSEDIFSVKAKNDSLENFKTTRYDHLIAKTNEVLSNTYPDLIQIWGKIALNWATTCPSRRLACNSFQIFRCILPKFDTNIQLNLVARLVGTISDEEKYLYDYSIEILATVNAYVTTMDPADLMFYPQLFWTSVACLTTVHEEEYLYAVKIAFNFLKRTEDLPECLQQLIDSFPKSWYGKFDGLQLLVLRGFRSTKSFNMSMQLFMLLMDYSDNHIVGNGYFRHLACLLVSLPAMLSTYETSEKLPFDLDEFCGKLTNLASMYENLELIELIKTYMKRQFRSSDDFLKCAVSYITSNFFEEFALEIITVLSMFLSNNLPWIRKSTLRILDNVLPKLHFDNKAYSGLGLNLISPLLRLLSTDYVMDALKLLTMPLSISGPSDVQTFKLLMIDPKTKNSDARFAHFFEIPDETGWSEPNSEYATTLTKKNVHAIFYMCPETGTSLKTPEIQFHAEEVSNYPRHIPTNSHGSSGENSLGELVTTLHSLDAFFAEDKDEHLPESSDLSDHSTVVYNDTSDDCDDHIVSILSGNLKREKEGFVPYESSAFGNYIAPEENDGSIDSSSDAPLRSHKASLMSKLRPLYFSDGEPNSSILNHLNNSSEICSSLKELRQSANHEGFAGWNLEDSEAAYSRYPSNELPLHENYYHLRTMFHASESNNSFNHSFV